MFSPADALAFLQNRLSNIDIEDAEKLTNALNGLPLALECAVAYMEENSYTPAEYLGVFEKHGLKVFEWPVAVTEYEKTILTVWSATFEKIREKAEHDERAKASLQLFRLCACCAPDDIPLKLFIDGRYEIPQPLKDRLDPDNEPEHNAVIHNLMRYSLVSMRRNEGKALIAVHRLIQLAANHNFGQNEEWVDYCLKIASSVFRDWGRARAALDAFSLNLPHMLEIARHSERFLTDKDSQKKIAYIYNEAGVGLQEQGDYEKALGLYVKAFAIDEKVFGMEHPSTATTYNNIATVYVEQGNYKKALGLCEKALTINEKVFGMEHPLTATTYSNMAVMYQEQGDYEKALGMYGKALAIFEKVLGMEHPSTALVQENLNGVEAKIKNPVKN